MNQHNLVIIEDNRIDGMLADEKFMTAFPFLRGLKPHLKKGCRSCGGGTVLAARMKFYGGVKIALANMDQNNKRKLKELLNAKNVRIIYRREGQPRPIQLTF